MSSKSWARCSCILLLFISIGMVGGQIEVPLPETINLFVTYRDFLPAGCVAQVDRSILTENWGFDGNNLQDDDTCDRLLDESDVYEAALLSGQIAGHPDYDAGNMFTVQDNCNQVDGELGINFPVGSCIAQAGDEIEHSIIGDRLTVGSNGLGIPPYCSDENGELTDCGATIAADDNPQTQGLKKFYDLWYTDNPVYNKRIGLRLELELADATTGEYAFSSAGNTANAADFPEDSDNNFFGPLNMFKQGGTREVPLTQPIEDAPAWPFSANNMRGGSDRSFWFSSEVHTTFEFRDGPDDEMTFTFSGDDDFWAFINGQLAVDVGGLHGDLSFLS